MYARDDYDKMGKGLNQQIYLGVVLLGAGALRCGALGCWCSWEIKRLNSHSPAIQCFDNGTSLHSMGTGYIRRYGGKVRCDEGGRKVRCDDVGR